MKKIITLFLFTLTSCYYQGSIQPTPVYYTGYYYQTPPQRDCTCGYVIDKGVDQWQNYYLDVQNQCSGNVKRFTFSKDDWTGFQRSDAICMTQNSSW
jgi:hypothetical protein